MIGHSSSGISVGFILTTMGFFMCIIEGFIVFPIIFNRHIIPEIEKKVGKKLEYNSAAYVLISNQLFWIGCKDLMRYQEISKYITYEYLAYKFKRPRLPLIKIDSGNALKSINYKLEMASKFEIRMSIFAYFSSIFLILFTIISIVLMSHGY